MYSFRMSFCTVPGKLAQIGALPLRHRGIQRQQNGRRGIDGHRGGDLRQRNAVEQRLHILQRTDGHAHLAHFSTRARVIGIEAHLRGQIERHRKPGLALREQVAKARVRLRRGAKSGVLPHGPQPAAIHRG